MSPGTTVDRPGDGAVGVEVGTDDVLHADRVPVDENHQVESPEVPGDASTVPPDRSQPLLDPDVGVTVVQRHRVIEGWRISIRLARSDQGHQLLQEVIGGPSQLDPRRGHADVQRSVGMHQRSLEGASRASTSFSPRRGPHAVTGLTRSGGENSEIDARVRT
jgi:hypothetical protein